MVARAPAENDARWGRHLTGPCVLEMAMDKQGNAPHRTAPHRAATRFDDDDDGG